MTPDTTEGVTKFTLDFVSAPPVDPTLLTTLNAWRTVLHRLGLTARDPNRYQGLAYGNVSRRVRKRASWRSSPVFLISGTQTAGLPQLDERHYSLVIGFDLGLNRIRAQGPLPPSSEALTHAAVYGADNRIACVIHCHSPEIWESRKALGLPTVPATVAYGTPEMAVALAALAKDNAASVIAMAGHRDGIVSHGTSVAQAAQRMIAALARALALTAPGSTARPEVG